MKWITVEGIREAETLAFAQRNLPSYTAMCRAGAAVARQAEIVAARAGITRIIVLCGPGNNGGDGFIAARCLKADGLDVTVLMTCVPAHLRGDAAQAWKDMGAVGLQATVLPSSDAWLESAWADPAVAPRRAIIVDALLGIGAKGAPANAVKAAINNVGKVILQDHIRHCIVDAVEEGDEQALEDLCTAMDQFMK